MSPVDYPLHDPSPGPPQAIRHRFAFAGQSRPRVLAGSANRPALRRQRRGLSDLTDWFIGTVARTSSRTGAQIPIAI